MLKFMSVLIEKNQSNFDQPRMIINIDISEEEIFCLNSLGWLFLNLGNLEKSFEYYNQSFEKCKKKEAKNGENVLFFSQVYNGLGELYEKMGNLGKSEEFKIKTLTIMVNLYGEGSENVAMSYNNLGSLYRTLGNLGKAEEFYKKALKIRLNLFGENHSNVADSYNNVGTLFII